VQDRIGLLFAVRLGEQLCARDLAQPGAQVEDRRGQVLRRVRAPGEVENPLWRRDAHVVYECVAVVPEAGSKSGAGGKRESHAARAAVEVERERRRPLPQGAQTRRQDLVDVGIALKNAREAVLDHYGYGEIGPAALEDFESGRRQDTVPQRAQTDYRHSRPAG
jgi:hypothetical protein